MKDRNIHRRQGRAGEGRQGRKAVLLYEATPLHI